MGLNAGEIEIYCTEPMHGARSPLEEEENAMIDNDGRKGI